MVYDNIIIGSGLSALGTALGLPEHSRTLVLAGQPGGVFTYYDHDAAVPAAYFGLGGLANYWHGVIPVGLNSNFGQVTPKSFEAFFSRFYPNTRITEKIGFPHLFVPRKPIRPSVHWKRLIAERKEKLDLVKETAVSVAYKNKRVETWTYSSSYIARKVWLCAGALHTPALLEASFGPGFARTYASDHVVAYLGQIDRRTHRNAQPPTIDQDTGGMWMDCTYMNSEDALCISRPARFDFKTIDRSIERRAAFGLPAKSMVAKVVSASSPGLIAEALFNRYGLFQNARHQNVYAQVMVPNGHDFHSETATLTTRRDIVLQTVQTVRNNAPYPGLRFSQRQEIFVPAIHLHDTLNLEKLKSEGINQPDSPFQIADASALRDIGPEHHSFKMMLAAYESAKRIAS